MGFAAVLPLKRHGVQSCSEAVNLVMPSIVSMGFPAPARTIKPNLQVSGYECAAARVGGCCRYFRMVLRSQPVSLLIPWTLIPCRCSSFSSCTSRPLNKSRNLLHVEWAPVYHARGGDFSTGTMGIFAPALTYLPYCALC